MKKYCSWYLILGFVFTLISTISINSYAKNKKWFETRSGIGARLSYVTYNNDEFNISDLIWDVSPDNTEAFGINYTYIADYYFSFEFSADYLKTDVGISALTTGANGHAGELVQIPVLITGRFHPYVSNRLTPFFSAGLGYYFNNFDSNSDAIEPIYGPGSHIEIDEAPGFFLGGGLEVFFSDNVALNLDLKYIWSQVKGTVSRAGTPDLDGFSEAAELDIDPFFAGLGIKYYF